MFSFTRTPLLRGQVVLSRFSSTPVARLPLNQRHVPLRPSEILRPPTNQHAFSTWRRRIRGRNAARVLNGPHLWNLNDVIKDKSHDRSNNQLGWKAANIGSLIVLPISAAVWWVHSSWSALKRKYHGIRLSISLVATRWGDRFRHLKKMEGAKNLISATKTNCSKTFEGLKGSMSMKNWWKSESAETSKGAEEPTDGWFRKMRSRYQNSESEKVAKVESPSESVEDGATGSVKTAAEKKTSPLRDRFRRHDIDQKNYSDLSEKTSKLAKESAEGIEEALAEGIQKTRSRYSKPKSEKGMKVEEVKEVEKVARNLSSSVNAGSEPIESTDSDVETVPEEKRRFRRSYVDSKK